MATSPLPPAITLTDPHNLAAEPSPVLSPVSPVKTVSTADSIASFELNYASSSQRLPRDRNGNAIGTGAHGRPGTANGRSGSVTSVGGQRRPETSSGRPSPGKLLRTTVVNARSPTRGSVSPQRQHAVSRQDAPAPLDPLSQQILQRTNGAQTLYSSNATLRPTTSDSASMNEDARSQYTASSAQTPISRSISRTDTETSGQGQAQKDLKKGVKAVSFLSRLIGNKKKDSVVQGSAVQDDDAVSICERRPEGAEVKVFAQPMVDNMGFSPRYPQPPAYIKVRSKYKPRRDFDRLFLAQELHCSKRRKLARTDSNKLRRKSTASPDQDTVWAMEFSKDGKYLAAAGADMVVRVWQVLSSPEDRHKHETQESDGSSNNSSHTEHLSAPVFQSKPIREYEGHGATVLDLSWSKNNFLLSSSMDKTVRLWHVSREECLCTFKHHDFVPSIAFHPKDDRFFLAGSLDSKLRLWSIPDKGVAFMVQVPEMITAVAFTPDGKSAMAGCMNGLCMFYDTDGLKYQTQIQVRSTRGQNARGSKITGIQAQTGPNGDTKVLISSNDSRIRLYNFRDKSLELKFKGNANNSSQIRATLSDDGRYVVCGSEDRKAYIWSVKSGDAEANDKRPLECFETHETITTAVCFAPSKTRTLLGKSEDPVYDVCNPPPVILLSSAERAGSRASSRPPTEGGSVPNTPADPDRGFAKPRESASYLARASHKAGNIIVTADYAGMIKVFRQDCAWNKRRIDDWDRGSIFGGKRGGGRSSRTGSVATKASHASLRDARTSATSQVPPSDRILSWRQGIASTSNVNSDTARESNTGTSRSISPRKSLGQASTRTEANVRSAIATTEEDSAVSTAPTSLDVPDRAEVPGHAKKDSGNPPARQSSPNSNKKDSAQEDADLLSHRRVEDPLLIGDSGRSAMFWDTANWKAQHERARKMHSEADVPLDRVASRTEERDGFLAVRPAVERGDSYVSRLSDERSSDGEGEGDEFDDAREEFR